LLRHVNALLGQDEMMGLSREAGIVVAAFPMRLPATELLGTGRIYPIHLLYHRLMGRDFLLVLVQQQGPGRMVHGIVGMSDP
jgi:hypothetical protein